MGITISYPQNMGGLGGLGGQPVQQRPAGFLNSDNASNIMQALGASLMGSPRNAPLQDFGQYLPMMQRQSMIERQDRREQQQLADAQAKEGRTLEYLRQNFPDIASMVDSGLPIGDAWTLAIKQKQGGGRPSMINLGDGFLYNESTGETINARAQAQGQGNGQFRFSGNSVEAQALNGLMDSNTLTPEQAQQLAAGKTITGPNGEIIFMTPEGVFSRPAEGAPAPSSGGNIQITGPKAPDVDERKASGFADRMSSSGTLIDQFQSAGTSRMDQFASSIPIYGNELVSEEYQRLDQARRDFVNAQLRRESGAVISPEEFDNANKQYFPQPGDTEQTIRQKADNRRIAIESMKRDAGPTYKGRSSLPAGVTEEDIEFTMRKHGLSREQVLERLR